MILPVRAVDQESICLAPADDSPGALYDAAQLLADAPQDFVAIGPPVALIDHVEVIDVHDDRVHGQVLVKLIELLRIAEKEFFVVESGQRVPLCLVDDIAVLRELDRSLHARLDHLRQGIGFGNKVDRAKCQALHLCRAVARHDDDRQLFTAMILANITQHVEAVDVRQDQVQQDQTERVVMEVDQ